MNEYSSASEHEEDDISSENEPSDDDSYLAKAVVAVAASRRNRQRDPQPMHNSRLTDSMRVEEMINGHEEIKQDLISMKSETFKALSNLLAFFFTNSDVSHLLFLPRQRRRLTGPASWVEHLAALPTPPPPPLPSSGVGEYAFPSVTQRKQPTRELAAGGNKPHRPRRLDHQREIHPRNLAFLQLGILKSV
ncbi:hypothetical protein TIFTF001_037240 [Ficus carica]|uniref:Uncharacterized protein n=1 Tax=Ficus carica TaxID=3494 RepID=A0AA88E8E3_FICCA|nr:hypothetical protein TIFTF001_037240 [Ficus carica]